MLHRETAYPVNLGWSQESRKTVSVWSTWTLLLYYQTQVDKRHTCTFFPASHIERGHHPFWLHSTTIKLLDTLTSHNTFRASAERYVIGNPSALLHQCHPPTPHHTLPPPPPLPANPPNLKAMNFPHMISLARISIIFFIFLAHAQL